MTNLAESVQAYYKFYMFDATWTNLSVSLVLWHLPLFPGAIGGFVRCPPAYNKTLDSHTSSSI